MAGPENLRLLVDAPPLREGSLRPDYPEELRVFLRAGTLPVVPQDRLMVSEPGEGESTITAAETLAVNRAVTADGRLLNTNPSPFGAAALPLTPAQVSSLLSSYAGVTLSSGDTGTRVRVRFRGPLEEPLWSWAPNQPVWVGRLGVLTQATPVLPRRRVGWAVTPTMVLLDPYPVIEADA